MAGLRHEELLQHKAHRGNRDRVDQSVAEAATTFGLKIRNEDVAAFCHAHPRAAFLRAVLRRVPSLKIANQKVPTSIQSNKRSRITSKAAARWRGRHQRHQVTSGHPSWMVRVGAGAGSLTIACGISATSTTNVTSSASIATCTPLP